MDEISEPSTQKRISDKVSLDVASHRRTNLCLNSLENQTIDEPTLTDAEIFFMNIAENPHALDKEEHSTSSNIPSIMDFGDDKRFLLAFKLTKNCLEKIIPILAYHNYKKNENDSRLEAMVFSSFICVLPKLRRIASTFGSRIKDFNKTTKLHNMIKVYSSRASQFLKQIMLFDPTLNDIIAKTNFQRLNQNTNIAPTLEDLNMCHNDQIATIRFSIIPIRFLTNCIPKGKQKDDETFKNTILLGRIVLFTFTSDGRFIWKSKIFDGSTEIAKAYIELLQDQFFLIKIQQFSPKNSIPSIFLHEVSATNQLISKNSYPSINIIFEDEIMNRESLRTDYSIVSNFVGLLQTEIAAYKVPIEFPSLIEELIDTISFFGLMKLSHEYNSYSKTRYKIYKGAYLTQRSIYSGNMMIMKNLQNIIKDDIKDAKPFPDNEGEQNELNCIPEIITTLLSEAIENAKMTDELIKEQAKNQKQMNNCMDNLSEIILKTVKISKLCINANLFNFKDEENKKFILHKKQVEEEKWYENHGNDITLIIFVPKFRRKILIKEISLINKLEDIISFLMDQNEDFDYIDNFICPISLETLNKEIPIGEMIIPFEDTKVLFTIYTKESDFQLQKDLILYDEHLKSKIIYSFQSYKYSIIEYNNQ